MPISPTPRQAAIAAGKKWYISDVQCPSCGTENPTKYVANGACGGCATLRATSDGRRTAESVMMREFPGLVVSRKVAVKNGSTVYRTGTRCAWGHDGFRYVSSGQCIPCLRGMG